MNKLASSKAAWAGRNMLLNPCMHHAATSEQHVTHKHMHKLCHKHMHRLCQSTLIVSMLCSHNVNLFILVDGISPGPPRQLDASSLAHRVKPVALMHTHHLQTPACSAAGNDVLVSTDTSA